MVIVSVAFVAIIVGALLSAAGYAYRLKLVNKNAKDNFYYVEQAMQEIYAGVGSKTIDQMYNAYTSTIENMVTYDITQDAYVTLSNKQANDMFKKQFMACILSEDYFNQSDELLAQSLANFITNDTVSIDTKALHKEKVTDVDGNIVKICLRNITLTRTSNYTNNAGSGVYTQTISADIEISQPDFEVNFDNTTADYSNIFDFAMVADMGVEVVQSAGTNLNITGNIYAASDYYNKKYNMPVNDADEFINKAGSTEKTKNRNFAYVYDADKPAIEYTHTSVSSKKNTTKTDTNKTGLYNKYAKDATNNALFFDGENQYSMNSGLYIDNSTVSILADTVIVPGTIAVMNNSDVSIYNRANGRVSFTDIWADNVVLGGYGEKVAEESTQTTYKAPNAFFSANLYVRDDLELNAERSTFALKGVYYGYGDSTVADERTFVPTVDTENFQIRVPETDSNGNIVRDTNGIVYKYQNRDHYNSSAIVINGQNTTLNLSNTSALYLAGRAYIELSKNVTYNAEDGKLEAGNAVEDGKVYVNANGQLTDSATTSNVANTEVVTETYEFSPATMKADGTDYERNADGTIKTYITDYKTGESLSIKTNQLAYIPIIMNGMPAEHEFTTVTGAKVTYLAVELAPAVKNVLFFGEYFPDVAFEGYVPVTSQIINNKTYFYYDFDAAYEILDANKSNTSIEALTNQYKNVDEYSAAFITDYTNEAANPTDPDNPLPLNDIIANDDFTAGNVIFTGSAGDRVANDINATVYSSGAITTKKDTAFNMVLKNTDADFSALLTSAGLNSNATITGQGNTGLKAIALSSELRKKYSYIKWNLGEFEDTELNEQAYVDKLFENGWTEDMLTPINRYLLMDNIDPGKDITPSNYELASGYKLWITDEDVVIGQDEKDFIIDNNGSKTDVVKGMIVTKGDVSFADTVTRFEGLIVAGGKIYIHGNLQNMTASPEICRSILRECMVVNDDDSIYIRNIFTEYRTSVDKCPVCGETLTEVAGENGTSHYECPQICNICIQNGGCKYNNTVNANELLVDVDKVDYTSVCALSNWNKTVE